MADPRFIGEVVMRQYTGKNSPYRGNDPGLELVEDFSFIDSLGVEWTAHKGDIVDGATIPWVLKPIIGGSYNHYYFNASVLHDVYTRDKQRPRRATNWMFYEAMLLNKTPWLKAYAMWLAVSTFGPRW